MEQVTDLEAPIVRSYPDDIDRMVAAAMDEVRLQMLDRIEESLSDPISEREFACTIKALVAVLDHNALDNICEATTATPSYITYWCLQIEVPKTSDRRLDIVRQLIGGVRHILERRKET